MSVHLEQLLANATPGRLSTETGTLELSYRDARLAALAPDMARLLIDMGEALRRVPDRSFAAKDKREALLARLDALGKEQT